MKNILFILTMSFISNISYATEDLLRNCFADASRAQFFTHTLEEIDREGDSAILILNEKKQVAGVISVNPERAEETKKVTQVTVNRIELCSPLEVDTFYYADGLAENLLDWTKGPIEITQDEGKIEIQANTVESLGYATLIRADFTAYDVFETDGNSNNDWGSPRGKGRFYYYIPKAWK